MFLKKYWLKILPLVLISLLFSGCQGLQKAILDYSESGVYHTVQEGQTLYRISQVYGVNLSRLQRINQIADPSQLKVGSRLWIPEARRVLSVPSISAGQSRPDKTNRDRPQVARKTDPPGTVAPLKGFLAWPVEGTLTSRFGKRGGRNHQGIDIGARTGTPIVAAAEGKVMFSGWGPTGYGKMVIVKHKRHLTTLYAHASQLWVKQGNYVKQGQKIAAVGSTGRSTGPHLHFEVRNDTHPKDPLKYLPKK